MGQIRKHSVARSCAIKQITHCREACRVRSFFNAINNNSDNVLHFAAFWDFDNLLKALISAGARRDERNKRGETPLHIAVLQGHEKVVRILLLAGVDVNVQAITTPHYIMQLG